MDSRKTQYAISGIRYDVDDARVHKVRVHRIRRGGIAAAMDITRRQLVSAVEYGTTFVAASIDGDGRVGPRTPVRLVHVDGEPYVRCDDDGVPSDDFPEVARF